MSLTRFLAMAVAVICAGCTSMDAIVVARENCKGDVASRSFAVLRDVATKAVLPELRISPKRRVLLLRSTNIDLPVPLLEDAVRSLAGQVDVKAFQRELAANKCWPQGGYQFSPAARSITDGTYLWNQLTTDDPKLYGTIVAGLPIMTNNGDEALVLVDYHCGDLCGSMWGVTLRRTGRRWLAVKTKQILQY